MVARLSLFLLAVLGLPAAAAAAADPLAPMDSASGSETIVVTGRLAPPRGPDALGTATLNAGVTLYDARFRRVAAADQDDAQLRSLAARLAGLDRMAQLHSVKALVRERVRLTDDLTAAGVFDYWDNAGETLRRGRGDGEDVAIAEMRALVLAGFPADDLFISVGRHRTIGAHAVLMARVGDRYMMLDATEPTVVEASGPGAGRFVPVLSIGPRGSWVHGRRVASASARGARLQR